MEQEKLLKVAEYLAMGLGGAGDPNLTRSKGAFVFCREDSRMAQAAARLYERGLIDWILLTGGIGVDSGEQSRRFGAEARYQAHLLTKHHGIDASRIHVEAEARNGAENSRFGIDMIRSEGLDSDLILVLHPRKARRVWATHEKIARDEKGFAAREQLICMPDPFDPDNPSHVKEVLEELVKLADWSTKGYCDSQPDLPLDLVEWAREGLKHFGA
ncbi:YdcF family protein [Candidatus Kaiserbacteria bacterium]|nr:YdcF family protein [Candidatus Kaiserbacteria bacterium]